MTMHINNDKLDRPLAFLDTSAWNLFNSISGQDLLRWLHPQYRLAYCDTVIHEILRHNDANKRAILFEIMQTVRAIRLFIQFDNTRPLEARWEVVDPTQIQLPSDPAPSLTAMFQKMNGAKKDKTFREVHESFAEEARQVAQVLTEFGRELPDNFESSLSESTNYLPLNADEKAGNARNEFQRHFD